MLIARIPRPITTHSNRARPIKTYKLACLRLPVASCSRPAIHAIRRATPPRVTTTPAKPHTVMFNKVTIKGAKQAVQMFGPAQAAVARAVADCVAEGTIPQDEANDVFICVGVFIHWEAADDTKIYDYNYKAVKESIERAVRGDPQPADVVAKRASAKHPFSPK